MSIWKNAYRTREEDVCVCTRSEMHTQDLNSACQGMCVALYWLIPGLFISTRAGKYINPGLPVLCRATYTLQC